MRLINADKLHVDKQINGECWISQEQIINASTVEAVPLSVIEKMHDAIDNADSDGFFEDEHGYIIDSTLTTEHIHEIIDQAIKECDT